MNNQDLNLNTQENRNHQFLKLFRPTYIFQYSFLTYQEHQDLILMLYHLSKKKITKRHLASKNLEELTL